MVRLAELLSYDSTVFIYGQEKYKEYQAKEGKIHLCHTIEECIESSEMIISGIPLSKDGVTLVNLYGQREIKLFELYEKMKYKTFIAGGIPLEFYENKTIHNVDLLDFEALTILNAIPTAEGTIKIAIEETENTIHESDVMIVGYGRIGKILCKDFKLLGANVYCVARKEADLAWIREEGYIPVRYQDIPNKVQKIDIIVNTVPALVIEERTLKQLKKDCIIIDVASSPGGVDKMMAKRYNIKVITALGLPGKVAPKTAAKYIKEMINTIK